MENKKNKKKLFAIIGASALAFILTVALSVSITLAYFGGSKAGTTTVTMDKAVTVDTVAMGSATVDNVLPGQKVALDATATVSAGTSGAFLAVKVEQTGDAITGLDAANGTFTGWTKHTDGYFYYVGEGTAPVVVANAGTAKLTGSFVVSKDLTNTVAEKTATITVTFVAVQGVAFDAAGDKIAAPTIANVAEMVAAVVAGA